MNSTLIYVFILILVFSTGNGRHPNRFKKRTTFRASTSTTVTTTTTTMTMTTTTSPMTSITNLMASTTPTTSMTSIIVTTLTTSRPITNAGVITTVALPNTLTTSTTASPSNTVAYTNYEIQALTQTNYRRARHCAPALSFHPDIRTIAQNYAQHLCNTKTFSHSSNKYQNQPLGENLYSVGSTQPISLNNRNGSVPVESWYSEIASYDFSSPGFSSSTGHFTQVVWVNSALFGLGYCCSADSLKCYVVANYFPAGNYQGQFVANVKQATCS